MTSATAQTTDARNAVVLLSGGLDSATVLAEAKAAGFVCYALTLHYGQRHEVEIAAARRVAKAMDVRRHIELSLDLRAWGGSALTGDEDVPTDRDLEGEGIPITYVPARNLIFLSVASGWAEVLGARDIFFGANAIDYSGYPDCREDFVRAFEETVRLGTRAGREGAAFRVHAPLIRMTKKEIIRRGVELDVDYGLTHSCYNPRADGRPCGVCDSCRLRQRGFEEAGLTDPLYR